MESREQVAAGGGEQGFMLLGLVVAMAIILLMLGVAASTAAFSLRREKELESARRADQYFRAIRMFQRKNSHYPGSLEQLENTNRVRYLRQRYVDPLTGKEYRLILVGENKSPLLGFFGQPLGGISATAVGTPIGGGVNGATGSTGASGATGSTGTASAGSGIGGTPATGPFMGVGSNATGPSIITVNGQTTYETWEFLWDPRLDQLKVAAALNGAGSEHPDSPLLPTSHQ